MAVAADFLSEKGWPFSGGEFPAWIALRSVPRRQSGLADRSGNRQFCGLGDLRQISRISIIAIDDAHRGRSFRR